MAITFTDDLHNNGEVTRIKKAHVQEIRDYLLQHLNQHTYNSVTVHPMASAANPGFMSAAHYNTLQNFITSGNGIMGVGVSDPLTSTGTDSPTIGIKAASVTSAGSMSIADYNKLAAYPAYSSIDSRLDTIEAKPNPVLSVTGTLPVRVDTADAVRPKVSVDKASATADGLLSKELYSKVLGLVSIPIGGTMLWTEVPQLSLTRGVCFDGDGNAIAGKGMEGWALCIGKTLSNGWTTPNYVNRFPLGAGVRNAFKADGTGVVSQNTDATDSVTYGTETVTLGSAQLPKHAHFFCGDDELYNRGTQEKIENTDVVAAKALGYTGIVELIDYDARSNGGGGRGYKTMEFQKRGDAHNNMPPFVVSWYIMRIA